MPVTFNGGVSMKGVRVGYSPFIPSDLFSNGEVGHWAAGYDPAGGRVFQVSDGTSPATAAAQPVGRANALAGGNDALQATSLSRPTLSRVPRGGRRNRFINTEDLGSVSWTKASCTVTDMGEGVWRLQAAAGAWAMVQAQPLGSTHTVAFDVRSNGAGLDSFRFMLAGGVVGSNLAATSDWVRYSASGTNGGSGNAGIVRNNVDAAIDVLIRFPQLELGTAATPYQRVVSARDVTEAGVPNVWHLNDDGNDSLPVSLPAGDYTAAWVNKLGAVTIAENVAVTTTLDALRGQDQADTLIINRALKSWEKSGLIAYWQRKYGLIPSGFGENDWYPYNTNLLVSNLPLLGAKPLTEIQYRVNNDAVYPLGGITTGTYPLSAAVDDDIEIRAVNAVGGGAWSTAKPAAFNPLSVFASGEVGALWDLQRTDTLFQTETTASPVTASDQVLGRINDLSPNGWHLTQATALNRPAQGTDGAGRRTAAWDRINDFLTYSGGMGVGTWTVAFAFDPAQIADAGVGIVSSAATPWLLVWENTTNTAIIGTGTSPSLWLGVDFISLPANRLAFRTALRASSGVLFYQGIFSDYFALNRFGAYPTAPSLSSPNFSRALLINRALTADERAALTAAWRMP